MLLTFLIVAGGALYVLRPATNGPAPSPGSQNANLIPDSDAITLKGTVVVPPPLQDFVKNGSGHLVVGILGGRQTIPIGMAVNEKNPKFPYSFTYRMSRSKLKGDGRFQDQVSAYTTYAQKELSQEEIWNRETFPFSEGYKRAMLTVEQVNRREFPNVIDFGNIYFVARFARARNEKCRSDKTLLSGTITPSADFLKNHGNKKFALVATPHTFTASKESMSQIGREDLPVVALGYQSVEFNGKAATFNLPLGNRKAGPLSLALVECRTGESTESCAVRRFPATLFRNYGDNKIFTVIGKGLARAECGEANFEGYVHRMRGDAPSLGAPPPNPPAGSTPLEYLSGETF